MLGLHFITWWPQQHAITKEKAHWTHEATESSIRLGLYQINIVNKFHAAYPGLSKSPCLICLKPRGPKLKLGISWNPACLTGSVQSSEQPLTRCWVFVCSVSGSLTPIHFVLSLISLFFKVSLQQPSVMLQEVMLSWWPVHMQTAVHPQLGMTLVSFQRMPVGSKERHLWRQKSSHLAWALDVLHLCILVERPLQKWRTPGVPQCLASKRTCTLFCYIICAIQSRHQAGQAEHLLEEKDVKSFWLCGMLTYCMGKLIFCSTCLDSMRLLCSGPLPHPDNWKIITLQDHLKRTRFDTPAMGQPPLPHLLCLINLCQHACTMDMFTRVTENAFLIHISCRCQTWEDAKATPSPEKCCGQANVASKCSNWADW